MLSPSITLMLDRVRADFGLQAEVLDVNLASVLGPDRQHELGVRTRPELTAAAMAALRDGRVAEVAAGERGYRLLPLRRNRTTAGLLVVEQAVSSVSPPLGRLPDGFVELLRSAIEADFASRDDVHAERQQTRKLRGILRFLMYVLVAGSEEEVAEAVIHAAAVWFDVDPRVYRRDPSGDFVLVSHLPAAEVSPGAERLRGLNFSPDVAVVRLSSLAEPQALGPVQDGVLLPARGAEAVDWVLVLLGSVPVDAELTLGIVARVVGAQMERLAMRRAEDMRRRFEEIVTERDSPAELRAVEVMRQLLWMTNGSGAALWVQSHGGMRRVALVGGGITDPGQELRSEHLSGPERHVRTISLGTGGGRLEVTASAQAPFTAAAETVVDACAEVLTVWLAGNAPHACAMQRAGISGSV